MANFHDAFRPSTISNLTVASAAGAAVSTAGFDTQTHWVQVSGPGAITSTGGYRIAIGDGPTATSSSMYLPFNWIQVYKVTPGQKVSALSNDGIAGRLCVVELTN
jgi:hypothetical protein